MGGSANVSYQYVKILSICQLSVNPIQTLFKASQLAKSKTQMIYITYSSITNRYLYQFGLTTVLCGTGAVSFHQPL